MDSEKINATNKEKLLISWAMADIIIGISFYICCQGANMFQSILGLFVFSGIAVLLSENKKKISIRLIISAISLQLVLGVVTLKFAWIRQAFFYLNGLVTAISIRTLR